MKTHKASPTLDCNVNEVEVRALTKALGCSGNTSCPPHHLGDFKNAISLFASKESSALWRMCKFPLSMC